MCNVVAMQIFNAMGNIQYLHCNMLEKMMNVMFLEFTKVGLGASGYL